MRIVHMYMYTRTHSYEVYTYTGGTLALIDTESADKSNVYCIHTNV